MSTLLGADSRRVDIIAEGLRRYSQDIQDLRTMAQRAVAEMRNGWGGPDFEGIAQRWEQDASPRLTDVSSALSTMATTLRTQAEAQRQASGNTDGSTVPVGTGGTPGGLNPGGPGGVTRNRNGDSGDGGDGPSSGDDDGIDDLNTNGLDVKLPTVSDKDYAGGDKHTEHGKLGPLETMDIDTRNGDQTDTTSGTYVNGTKVGTETGSTRDLGEGTSEQTTGDKVRGNTSIDLAGGEVGAEAALASLKGGNGNAEYELAAGKVEADAEYSAGVDANGNLVVGASASAAAYLGYAAGKVQVGSESLNARADGKVFVGAEANADANASIGKDGLKAHVGGEVFAGGKAEANVGGTAAGVTASAGAEVSYGIGAHASADAEVSMDNVGVSVDIGATLGIGGGVSFDISVSPNDVIEDVGNVADNVGEGIGDAADAVGDFFSW